MPKKGEYRDKWKGKGTERTTSTRLNALQALSTRTPDQGGPVGIDVLVFLHLHFGGLAQSVALQIRDRDTLVVVPELYWAPLDAEKTWNTISRGGRFSVGEDDGNYAVELLQNLQLSNKRIVVVDTPKPDAKAVNPNDLFLKRENPFIAGILNQPGKPNSLNKTLTSYRTLRTDFARLETGRQNNMVSRLSARINDLAKIIADSGKQRAKIVFLVGGFHTEFGELLKQAKFLEGINITIAKDRDDLTYGYNDGIIVTMESQKRTLDIIKDRELLLRGLFTHLTDKLIFPEEPREFRQLIPNPLHLPKFSSRNEAGLYFQFLHTFSRSFSTDEIESLLANTNGKSVKDVLLEALQERALPITRRDQKDSFKAVRTAFSNYWSSILNPPRN